MTDMTETKQEQRARLQARTDELKQRTIDLDLARRPFNQAEHDEHGNNLRKHRIDLAAYRLRLDDDSN